MAGPFSSYFARSGTKIVALPRVTGIRTVGTGLVVCLRAHGDHPPVELPVSRRHTRMLKDRLVRAPKQSWTAR